MANQTIRILPSVQIMELMSQSGPYHVGEVVQRLLQFHFYQAIETALVWDAQQASQVHTLCRSHRIRWTCWASAELAQEQLNLSSLSPSLRRHSLQRVIQFLQTAGEQGADAFAVLSGPAPEDPSDLPKAVSAFGDSLRELALAARSYPHMDLLLEPLDRWVHKKSTIGPTRQAAELIRSVRHIHPNTFMAWDSAHTVLNREDPVTSLRIAGDTVCQLHLCNAVLDDQDLLYGDHHIAPGDRGYLTLLRGADIICEAARLPLLHSVLPVAVEVRPRAGEDPWKLEADIRSFLRRSIEYSQLGRPSDEHPEALPQITIGGQQI